MFADAIDPNIKGDLPEVVKQVLDLLKPSETFECIHQSEIFAAGFLSIVQSPTHFGVRHNQRFDQVFEPFTNAAKH